jgi:hypothetical protein
MSWPDHLRSSIFNSHTIPHPMVNNSHELTGPPPQFNIQLPKQSIAWYSHHILPILYTRITNWSTADRRCSMSLILDWLIHIQTFQTSSERSVFKSNELNWHPRESSTIRRQSADGLLWAFVTYNITSFVWYIWLKGVWQDCRKTSPFWNRVHLQSEDKKTSCSIP